MAKRETFYQLAGAFPGTAQFWKNETECKKKRKAKREAIKIIETLGEDVYEVFDEIIKKKS